MPTDEFSHRGGILDHYDNGLQGDVVLNAVPHLKECVQVAREHVRQQWAPIPCEAKYVGQLVGHAIVTPTSLALAPGMAALALQAVT